jgi:hypothetical protein
MAQPASLLTPFQLTVTDSLLHNQGISVNAQFVTNMSTFNNLPYITALTDAIAAATSSGAQLSPTIYPELYSLGSGNCAALGDSIPVHTGNIAYPGNVLFGNLLLETAYSYMGQGPAGGAQNLSIFCQGFGALVGYNGITNNFINSAVNSQNYLGGTYTNADNMVSGGITSVNVCTAQWGNDLAKLGGLIDLSKLDELGTPLALVQQLASIGGITPDIALYFSNAGVSPDVVINLASPTVPASDADQKAMYAAMTQITGTALTQILRIMGITTTNINTMADLLNPYKLFPTSFQTLTVTGSNGVSQNIYTSPDGTVNSTLNQYLPKIALSSLS